VSLLLRAPLASGPQPVRYAFVIHETLGAMTDFFISYTQEDRSWAEWIAWVFEEKGYAVTIQAWDFRPGGNFVLDMQKAASAKRSSPPNSSTATAASLRAASSG
jgi:hypothetical protein